MSWQQNKPIVPRPGVAVIKGVRPDFTRSGKQRFMIQVDDGKEYSTFDPQLASQVQTQWLNIPGTLLIEQNGQYENFGGFQPGGAGGPGQVTAPQFPQQAGAPIAQFTPAPGFEDTTKRSVLEMRRSVALETATAIIAAVAQTGFYLGDEGLDFDKIASDTFALTAAYGPYLANGPAGAAVESTLPALPPGVTPDQVQAWAAQQGAAIAVGAPIPDATPAEVPVADASTATAPY